MAKVRKERVGVLIETPFKNYHGMELLRSRIKRYTLERYGCTEHGSVIARVFLGQALHRTQ